MSNPIIHEFHKNFDKTKLNQYDEIDVMLEDTHFSEFSAIDEDEDELDQMSDVEARVLKLLEIKEEELDKYSNEISFDPYFKQNQFQSTQEKTKTPKLSVAALVAIAMFVVFISTTGFKSPVINEAVSHYRHQLSIDVNSSTSIEAWLEDGAPFKFKLPQVGNGAFLIGARVSRLTTGKDQMQDAVLLSYGVASTHLTSLVYQYDTIDFSYDEKIEKNGKQYYFVKSNEANKPNSLVYQDQGLIYIFTANLDQNAMISLF